MGRFTVFNSTQLGASHLASGKPCQDSSLCYQSGDGNVQVAVVCDGHGGTTYVRSDVGSRLAADITLRNVLDFVADGSKTALFVGCHGAVTAHPSDNMAELQRKKSETPKLITESDEEELAQAELFESQIAGIREQDYELTLLFGKIYTQWLAAIEADMVVTPFSETEAALLGGKRPAKAYGTTLQCFVRTPLYWLAFHLGDGKITACMPDGTWREPVPWDCRCFLNLTTSLCDTNPVPEFRYAFDGTGDFPVSVVLGSDGLDDSWGTFDNLTTFYDSVVKMFADMERDKAVAELDDYLPRLSAKASRDDMSVAGILDLEAIAVLREQPDGEACEAQTDAASQCRELISSAYRQSLDEYEESERRRIDSLRMQRAVQTQLVSDEALAEMADIEQSENRADIEQSENRADETE